MGKAKSQRDQVLVRVRQFLDEIYAFSKLAPSPDKREAEAADITDEVMARYSGDFAAWLRQFHVEQEAHRGM